MPEFPSLENHASPSSEFFGHGSPFRASPALIMFALMAAAGMGVRIYCLFALPLERLIELWVTDDAFYYFVTAGHWANGASSTFDLEHFTNGYHPLWMFLSVAVFKMLGGATPGAVKFMLLLSMLFQLATSLLIINLGRRILNSDWAACLAGGLFLIMPVPFVLAFSGLETALAVLCLTAFFSASLRAWDDDRINARTGLICGGLAGLSFLARTDQVFFLMGVWGVMFLAGRATVKKWVVANGLIALVVVAPWLLWNYFKTGHIVQASAAAYPMLLWHHAGVYLASIGQENTFWNRFPYLVPQFFTVLRVHIPNVLISHQVLWCAVAGTALLAVMARPQLHLGENAGCIDQRPLRPWLLLIPLIGLVALGVVHGMIRGYPRQWYFAAVAVPGTLGIGYMVMIWRTAFRSPFVPVALVIIFLAVGCYSQTASARVGHYINQGFHRQAALWANENLPEDARIGAFNAGVFNYYCDRTVINLDGTTNNDVLPALADKTMWSYIEAERIDYLIDARFSVEVDYPVVMDVEGYPDRVLERVHRVEHIDPNFEFYVYRVIRGEEVSDPDDPSEEE